MKFLILKTKNPYLNLAIEEYLFTHEQDDVFMLWQNEPTVVIGKNQNTFTEINMPLLRKKNVHIARRITGGGAVYHDDGNLNYTFISSEQGQQGLDFKSFTAPMIDALATMGIHATLSGRNDLLVDGKKFSGNAQCCSNGRVLHHGTLLFDSDLSMLSEILSVDASKLRSKGIPSVRSRVINLKELLPKEYTVEDFISRIAEAVIDRYTPRIITAPEGPQIDMLTKRNCSEKWLYPRNGIAASNQHTGKRKYPFGLLEISMATQKNRILDLRITGDFFGSQSISALEERLRGALISDLPEILPTLCLENYIYGMSNGELLELILWIFNKEE